MDPMRGWKLHPALVDFPIAFLLGAWVTDLVFWRTGAALWAEFSFWLILAGWLAGLAAVLTGLVEFLAIRRARFLPAGWLHFLLGDAAIFLAFLNLAGRVEDRQASIVFSGLGFSTATAVSLLIAGYLGGQLVYRHQIGVYGVDQESSEHERG